MSRPCAICGRVVSHDAVDPHSEQIAHGLLIVDCPDLDHRVAIMERRYEFVRYHLNAPLPYRHLEHSGSAEIERRTEQSDLLTEQERKHFQCGETGEYAGVLPSHHLQVLQMKTCTEYPIFCTMALNGGVESLNDLRVLALEIDIESLVWTTFKRLVERRHLHTLPAERVGPAPVAGERIAGIEPFEFCECELLDESAPIGVPIQGRIVPDHYVPISGEMHVGLDHIDSHRCRTSERLEGVFGILVTIAPMSYHPGHRLQEWFSHTATVPASVRSVHKQRITNLCAP